MPVLNKLFGRSECFVLNVRYRYAFQISFVISVGIDTLQMDQIFDTDLLDPCLDVPFPCVG